MSTPIYVEGDNFTKANDPKSSNIMDMGIWGGKVRVQKEHWKTADFDIGSTLKVARLPIGATWLESVIYHGALGATTKIDMGDADDPDRYVDNADLAAAGVLQVRATDLGQGYKVLGIGANDGNDQDVMLTVATGADVADAIEIDVYTYYTQE